MILAQDRYDGAPEVQIEFNPKEDTVSVLLKKDGGWTEAMIVPTSIEEPLLGVIAQVEGIGFTAVAPRLWQKHPLPVDVKFTWIGRQRLEIAIDPPPSKST